MRTDEWHGALKNGANEPNDGAGVQFLIDAFQPVDPCETLDTCLAHAARTGALHADDFFGYCFSTIFSTRHAPPSMVCSKYLWEWPNTISCASPSSFGSSRLL